MNAQRTPGPWKIHRTSDGDFITDGMISLGEVYRSFSWPANADFIVRACNSHDELLAALIRASQRITSFLYADMMREYGNNADIGNELADAIKGDSDLVFITSAIKKAKG